MNLLRLALLSLIAVSLPLSPFLKSSRFLRPDVILQQSNPRVIRVAPANGVVGGTIGVSVELISQGDENAVSFTLTYNSALLTNPQVELGSGATGSLLTVNPNQAAQGRIGVVLSLPAGQQFSAGTRQILSILFRVPANASVGSTPVGFGDQPVRREVVDANARSLSGNFIAGQVIITPEGYEADVSPRPNGENDGNITLADFVQVGRYVAGLDTPTMAGEFQRADCAPLNTLGDGRLTVTDWAQAGRYVAGLDAVQRAGGPVEPVATAFQSDPVFNDRRSSQVADKISHIYLDSEILKATGSNELQRSVTIVLNARGDENALGFSLSFNPAQWRFVSASTGRDAGGARLLVNAKHAAQGRIGLAMAIPAGPAGQGIGIGEQQLLVLRFAAMTNAAPFTASFCDSPVVRELANVNARTIPVQFLDNSSLLAIIPAANF